MATELIWCIITEVYLCLRARSWTSPHHFTISQPHAVEFVFRNLSTFTPVSIREQFSLCFYCFKGDDSVKLEESFDKCMLFKLDYRYFIDSQQLFQRSKNSFLSL